MSRLFQRHCVTLANLKLWSVNRILRGWGIFILCALLLPTAWAEWINQTNGLGALLVSRRGRETEREREKGMVGVKAHTLENELLSFKPKSHMMGKQRSGTTLWQRLVSDFSLRTTTAFGCFWRGEREMNKKKNRAGERSYSRGEKKEGRGEGGEERYSHGSPALSSSRKVHWNSCSDSCHLFSCSLVPRVHPSAFTVCSTWQKGQGGLSNLQQPGTGSQPSYIFQMKFIISIMDLSQCMDRSSLFGVSLADIGSTMVLDLLKEKQPVIWQTVMVV